jgi:hypothetical protein
MAAGQARPEHFVPRWILFTYDCVEMNVNKLADGRMLDGLRV